MILEYRTAAWWYWLTTLLLLGAYLAGWGAGLYFAMLATTLHAIHFLLTGYGLTSFPLQVRIAYLLLLVTGTWPSLVILLWAMLAGTTARVLFAYCFLARSLSLMPWNSQGPLTMARVRRIYLTPPTRGSILDSLGDNQPA